MPGEVDVANRALSRVGSKRITSLSDDVKAARACNSAFEHVRDEVLRAAPWNSAVRRASLAKLATSPAWGFDNEYQWPSDALRILEVDTIWVWTCEGRKILTDEDAPLNIRYVAQETDVNQWDPALLSAVAARLALEIVEELTQSAQKKQDIRREYLQMVSDAKRADGQEGSTRPFTDGSWILARL